MRPQAVQKLNTKGKPIKSARCPLPSHVDRLGRGALSSNFLGEQQDFEGKKYWSFSCHHGGKPYHVFQADPDPEAPKTTEEYPIWHRQQVDAKRKSNEKSLA